MKLSTTKKRTIITVGIVLILALCIYAFSELLIPRYKQEDKIKYAYTSSGNINYKVHLMPNIMYDKEYLEEGKYYVFKYIDYVDLFFTYDYVSNQDTPLNSEYSITAYLQGLHGDENEVLWSKEYPLVPAATKSIDNFQTKLEFNERVYLNQFAQLKDSLYLDSEVNSPVVLNVVFNVHTTATLNEGTPMEDKMSPNLIIPIGSSVFKMEGTPQAKGANKIVEKLKTRIPVNYARVYISFGVTLLLLAGVTLATLAGNAVPPDPFEKAIANIFKEYSERLAGMNHTISYQLSDVISVNNIEDMVKIADEVGQPIFYYKVDSEMERKIEFFVFDNGRIYYMAIFGEIKAIESNLLQ